MLIDKFGQIDMDKKEFVAGDNIDLRFIYENGNKGLPQGYGVFFIFPTYWFYGVRTEQELGSLKKDNFYYVTYSSHQKYFQKDFPQNKGYLEINIGKNARHDCCIDIVNYPWADDLRHRNITVVFARSQTGAILPRMSFDIHFKNIIVPILAGDFSMECGISEGIIPKASVKLPFRIISNLKKQDEKEIFMSQNPETTKKKIWIGRFDKYGNMLKKNEPSKIEKYSSPPKNSAGNWFKITASSGKEYSRATLNKTLGYNLYWGDLHSHTEMSGHAVGAPEDVLNYAKNVSGLDFYAQIDHLEIMTERDRKTALSLMENNNKPGYFVTFNGYEYKCEGRGENNTDPASHFNFYFKNAEDYFIPRTNGVACIGGEIPIDNLLEQLAKKSDTGNIIIAAHQLGENCSCITWRHTETPFEPFLEIYSHHGTSEFYNPDDSLYYNNVHMIDHENKNHDAVYGPHYARDAWANGRKLGVTASSDSHIGKPGINSWGLTGVYSENLDRDSIFEAFLKRRTYATTGEKIILYFKANGVFMGEELNTNESKIYLEGEVFGTDKIDYAEIIKLDISARIYSVVAKLHPNEKNRQYLRINMEDELKNKNQMYFIRVFQKNEIRGRVVRAWSSPIWVTAKNNS